MITNDNRYFQHEDNYIECYIEPNMLKYIRSDLLLPTEYNHFNVETIKLNEKELSILSEELGLDILKYKILSLWS